MSDIVIQAENLGKKYTIGHQAERGRYLALRDVPVNNACKLCARPWYHTDNDKVKGQGEKGI